jgi:predicted transcriptional regulator
MNKIPCEYIVWYVLPIIRRGIAMSMLKDYGLNQNEIAKKLGISPAAVSQYKCGKRAKTNFIDKEICKEIKISAEKIIKNGGETEISEICRLCKIITLKIFTMNSKVDKIDIL